MKRVLIESPFKTTELQFPNGTRTILLVEENVAYVRACMRDALLRGEAPFASHALYTLAGVLDDLIPKERKLGIDAGLVWGEKADVTVVYWDRGITEGMQYGIEAARKLGRAVEFRQLGDPWKVEGVESISLDDLLALPTKGFLQPKSE